MIQEEENSEENVKPLLANGTKSCTNELVRKPGRYKLDTVAHASTPANSNRENVEEILVPPDGGWGWFVLFGSMLVNILVPGTVKSFGVLFVEFLEVFEASPSAGAWIPALCYFLYSSLGPLSSILSVKFSYRIVTLLGGTCTVVGMILSFWAQSVTYLYFSYGLLVGTGAGLAFPPTVYIVTSYFVRFRGLANGLCISGSAMGSILLPPLLRFLLETYGYRGAVLIMGGITLNVWVGALLYHPVEKHMKRVPKPVDQAEENHGGTELTVQVVSEEECIAEPAFIRSESSIPIHGRQLVSPVRSRAPGLTAQIRSSPALQVAGRTSNRSMDIFSQSRLPRSRLPLRSPSVSSFQYVSTPYHGSTLSTLKPEEFASSLALGGKSDTTQSKPCTKYFDITLLKDPIYLVILISNCTNAISYTNFIILLPSYAILLDYDKSLAAWLISIVSAFDLVGRIGGSALSDTNLMPKQFYFIGGLLISGIALVLLPFAPTYLILSACCSVFGIASGVYVGVTAVIMADMLGTERLTSTYGISLFVNGILQLIGPPICGIWFESSGTYVPLFTTLGVVLILGAAIWAFVPFIKKREKRNNQNHLLS